MAGRYRLDERLGAGGMSTVYLGLDSVLERRVAVKLLAEHLAADDAFVARFRREALAAAGLQHPNIVQVFDSGQDPDTSRHFIVMEYVDGPSCADLLRDEEMLAVDDATSILQGACNALDYAHRQGIVHRDVKPGNLLISRSGNVKLADFGIAKAAEQTRITQVGSVLGTAAYLSPEQARGEEAGPASDIYSLGVCAYQFLTGRLPHDYASLTELALKQQSDSVRPITDYRPEVPEALDRAIRVCLESDPGARYASALDLGEALAAGSHGELTETTRLLEQGATGSMDPTAATHALPRDRTAPAPVAPRTPPPARAGPVPARPAPSTQGRRRLLALVAALAVLAAGVLVALTLLEAPQPEPPPPAGTIDAQDFEDQVEEIKAFIQENVD